MANYSRSVMKWEQYLQVNSFAEDINKSLKQHSNRINFSISNASQEIIDSNIASQEEITRVLQHGFGDIVDSIDLVGESVESFRADFNFAMGKVLWKLELVQGTLTGILQEIRLAEFEREARSFRERAEDAYKNGWYKESLSDFLEAEKRNYQDFAVLFSIANIYLYRGTECEDDNKEPSLEKALAYYLKSAKYSTPKSKKHAAKSYLFSGWICYLLEKDDEALDYTSKAIELNPVFAEAYFQKAKILMCLNAPDKALVPLRKAIEIDRNYSIKASMDEDFKPYKSKVCDLIDNLRKETEDEAETALIQIEANIAKTEKLQVEEFSPKKYPEFGHTIHYVDKGTTSKRHNTYYGHLDALLYFSKAEKTLIVVNKKFTECVEADVKKKISEAESKISVINSKISSIQNRKMRGGWIAFVVIGIIVSFIMGLTQCAQGLKANNQHAFAVQDYDLRSKGYDPEKMSLRERQELGYRTPPHIGNAFRNAFYTLFTYFFLGGGLFYFIAFYANKVEKKNSLKPLSGERERLMQIIFTEDDLLDDLKRAMDRLN